MARMNGILEVDAGEDGEDVGLQERDQQFEHAERHRQAERKDGTKPAGRPHKRSAMRGSLEFQESLRQSGPMLAARIREPRIVAHSRFQRVASAMC
jgi:hypothetical protein